jgi:hypothetical protein
MPSALVAEVPPLSGPFEGMTIQVVETLAPQVLLHNPTSRTLEVLDDRGRAFVRIGPQGVEADLAASAWYNTYSTAGVEIPAYARDVNAEPRWRRMDRDPAWGWFDPRVDPERGRSGDHHGSAPADDQPPPKVWRIPVRVDGVATELRGDFVAKRLPRGQLQIHIEPETLPPGLSVTPSSGRPPALFARYSGALPLVVMGMENEPYLRFSAERGVEANLLSSTWRRYGRAALAPPEGATAPAWHRISAQASLSWLEPRAAYLESAPRNERTRQTVRRWVIPMVSDQGQWQLRGRTDWLPEPSSADDAGHGH